MGALRTAVVAGLSEIFMARVLKDHAGRMLW